MQLATASDEHVHAFAARWGPLLNKSSEALADWRRYAILLRALSEAAGRLAMERPIDPIQGKVILEWLEVPQTPGFSNIWEGAGLNRKIGQPELWRALLNGAITKLLKGPASCEVCVKWSGNRIRSECSCNTLLGILILQVLAQKEVEVCAGCRREFEPKRRATTGIRRYCDRCRKRSIPQRDAMRAMRRRKLEAGD